MCFFSQKNQKRISLLFIRPSQIFLSKKQVSMKWHSEKVRGNYLHFVHRICLTRYGWQLWHGMLCECGVEKAIKTMSSKTQSFYRQMRKSWLSVGSNLRKYSRSFEIETAWIGITDWHTLTWQYICLLIS